MMMPAVVAPILGIRSRIPAIDRQGERVWEAEDHRRDPVDGPANYGDRQVAEHVARCRLDDPVRDPQVALPLVPIEQTAGPVPHARFLDQPEERQEDNRESEGDHPESRGPDVGDSARRLAHPHGDVARVLPQRVERVATAVDEVAHIAVPDLVHDVWQVVAEPAHGAADRLHEHQQDGTDDNKGPHHEHRGGQPPAPVKPPLHKRHHRQQNRDAEDRDEDHEKDLRDRCQRSREGDDAGDQQDRLDRDRDLELATTGAAGPRGGFCRAHLLFIPVRADDLEVHHRAGPSGIQALAACARPAPAPPLRLRAADRKRRCSR